MANVHRGAFPVIDENGNEVAVLRYTAQRLCELEEHHKKPLPVLMKEYQDPDTIGISRVVDLLKFGIEGSSVQQGKAAACLIIDQVGLEKAAEAMMLALCAPLDVDFDTTEGKLRATDAPPPVNRARRRKQAAEARKSNGASG